jgi:hypothetical protein
MSGLKESVPLTYILSLSAAPCSSRRLSGVIGNGARGYVIHSPVPVCEQGGPAASPSISPHYRLLQGGEAD